jgi:glyoxylase-like metal-dependent hydrolase (beta-lactamase superfamily II)
VIAAPGHTEESVVFYTEASGGLIAGDLILGRKDGQMDRFFSDWSDWLFDMPEVLCLVLRRGT